MRWCHWNCRCCVVGCICVWKRRNWLCCLWLNRHCCTRNNRGVDAALRTHLSVVENNLVSLWCAHYPCKPVSNQQNQLLPHSTQFSLSQHSNQQKLLFYLYQRSCLLASQRIVVSVLSPNCLSPAIPSLNSDDRKPWTLPTQRCRLFQASYSKLRNQFS